MRKPIKLLLHPAYSLSKAFTIIWISFLTFESFAQELDTTLQANEKLHPFSMSYYGSEFQVDPNYQYVLAEIAQSVAKDSSTHLHVRGHVCCGPSKRLSKRRAKKVYKYLIALGAPKDRMSWKGYSDTCPRAWPEKTREDEAANRRVDFVIRKVK
jgi:outer membrane protein OmpA-like peptidoglycan-associated protein